MSYMNYYDDAGHFNEAEWDREFAERMQNNPAFADALARKEAARLARIQVWQAQADEENELERARRRAPMSERANDGTRAKTA
jgi:hypothetical protein